MTTKQQQVKEYTTTEAALAALRKDYEGTIFPVETKKGLTDAKTARRSIITLRTDLEKARKKLKAPIIERGKLLDSEAKRITAELVALEVPIDKQIKVEEARIEAEKEKARLAEEARIEAIKVKIQHLRDEATFPGVPSVRSIDTRYDEVMQLDIDEDTYAEFVDDANTAHLETLQALRRERGFAVEREAEAAQVAADRAELEKLRKEKEAREAEETPEIDIPADINNGGEPEPEKEGLNPMAPEPFTELKSMPPSKPYPGTQTIINLVAVQFGVSLPLASEWVCRARNEIAERVAL